MYLVVAEEARLLGPAHPEARLLCELLVQRCGGALHGANHDKVRSINHHPDDSPGPKRVVDLALLFLVAPSPVRASRIAGILYKPLQAQRFWLTCGPI
jgi:hypothetical protein